jgi:hypothetical protein
VPIEPWYTAYIVESTSSYADIGVVPYEAYAIVEVRVYAYGKGSNMRFRWASGLGAYQRAPIIPTVLMRTITLIQHLRRNTPTQHLRMRIQARAEFRYCLTLLAC